MIDSKEWVDWLNKDFRFMWIHGIPGAGKTELASILIERLIQSVGITTKSSDTTSEGLNSAMPPTANLLPKACGEDAVLYYYCYFGHSQDETIPFLRWVVAQLCRQAGFVVRKMENRFNLSHQPNLSDLLDALEEVLPFFDSAYIVIDAVDETQEPRTRLLRLLNTLVKDPRFQKVQLLATSREYHDIEAAFQDTSIAISMKNEGTNKDILTCVHAELERNSRFSTWPVKLRDDIEVAIATKAKGM
jgi:hypothetical protein